MNNKKIIFLFTIFHFSCSLASSQPENVFYIDFGILISATTANIGIGLNYERMLNNNVSLRIGVNLVSDQSGRTNSTNLMLGIPISAQFFTSANNRLEGGIGSGIAFNVKGYVQKNMFPGLVLRAGYRYQKRDGEGKFIKAGLEFPSNMYISLVGFGYSK